MTSVRGRIALSRCSSPSTEGGTTTRVPSAYGTRMASPWPPSWGPPQRAPCTQELGKPARQNSQVPSEIKKGEITRSPLYIKLRTSPRHRAGTRVHLFDEPSEHGGQKATSSTRLDRFKKLALCLPLFLS